MIPSAWWVPKDPTNQALAFKWNSSRSHKVKTESMVQSNTSCQRPYVVLSVDKKRLQHYILKEGISRFNEIEKFLGIKRRPRLEDGLFTAQVNAYIVHCFLQKTHHRYNGQLKARWSDSATLEKHKTTTTRIARRRNFVCSHRRHHYTVVERASGSSELPLHHRTLRQSIHHRPGHPCVTCTPDLPICCRQCTANRGMEVIPHPLQDIEACGVDHRVEKRSPATRLHHLQQSAPQYSSISDSKYF